MHEISLKRFELLMKMKQELIEASQRRKDIIQKEKLEKQNFEVPKVINENTIVPEKKKKLQSFCHEAKKYIIMRKRIKKEKTRSKQKLEQSKEFLDSTRNLKKEEKTSRSISPKNQIKKLPALFKNGEDTISRRRLKMLSKKFEKLKTYGKSVELKMFVTSQEYSGKGKFESVPYLPNRKLKIGWKKNKRNMKVSRSQILLTGGSDRGSKRKLPELLKNTEKLNTDNT